MFRVVSSEDIRPVALALRRAPHDVDDTILRYTAGLQDGRTVLYTLHCGALQGSDRSPISTVRSTLVIYSAYRLRITLGQRPVGSGPLTGALVVSPIFSVGLLLKKVTLWGCCTENVNDPRRAASPSASVVRFHEGVVPQLLSLFIYLFRYFFYDGVDGVKDPEGAPHAGAHLQ